MTTLILIVAMCILLYCSVITRLIICHPVKTVAYGVKDFIYYIKHRQFDYYEAGVLNCYCAHFGGGKTLSIVHYVNLLLSGITIKRCGIGVERNLLPRKYI